MTKIYYIPLHIGDTLAESAGMDARIFGAYISLLIAHYQVGEEGLPTDDQTLARMARVSIKVWNKIRPAVLRHFHLNMLPGKEEIRLFHDGCLESIQKIEKKSAINKANVQKRWKKEDTVVQRPYYRRSAIQNQNHISPLNSPRLVRDKEEEGLGEDTRLIDRGENG